MRKVNGGVLCFSGRRFSFVCEETSVRASQLPQDFAPRTLSRV